VIDEAIDEMHEGHLIGVAVPRSVVVLQLPFRVLPMLQETRRTFLFDAVIRLFPACCSSGWTSPDGLVSHIVL
jgi:hypothetical protein